MSVLQTCCHAKAGRAETSAFLPGLAISCLLQEGPLRAENTPPLPPPLQQGLPVEAMKSNSPRSCFSPICGFKSRLLPSPPLRSPPPPKHLRVPERGLCSALPPASGFGSGRWSFCHETRWLLLCFRTRPASDFGV